MSKVPWQWRSSQWTKWTMDQMYISASRNRITPQTVRSFLRSSVQVPSSPSLRLSLHSDGEMDTAAQASREHSTSVWRDSALFSEVTLAQDQQPSLFLPVDNQSSLGQHFCGACPKLVLIFISNISKCKCKPPQSKQKGMLHSSRLAYFPDLCSRHIF